MMRMVENFVGAEAFQRGIRVSYRTVLKMTT